MIDHEHRKRIHQRQGESQRHAHTEGESPILGGGDIETNRGRETDMEARKEGLSEGEGETDKKMVKDCEGQRERSTDI